MVALALSVTRWGLGNGFALVTGVSALDATLTALARRQAVMGGTVGEVLLAAVLFGATLFADVDWREEIANPERASRPTSLFRSRGWGRGRRPRR